MNNRERALAVLNEQPYDKLPIVDFGFNQKLLQTWNRQGHFDASLLAEASDGGRGQLQIEKMLGFDFNWQGCLVPLPDTGIYPSFPEEVLEEYANGTKKVISRDGAIHIIKDGLGTIPSDVGTMLKDRQAWEDHYVHRLQFSEDRLPRQTASVEAESGNPRGLHCGSLYGQIRNWLGVQGISYL